MSFQKSLLQEVWDHFRSKGEWPILRRLYSEHGTEKVKKALRGVGRCAGWEESGPQLWSRYRVSLLGVLLTNDGPKLQALMTRLFFFQRQMFQTEPEKPYATSAEIAKALG